MKTPKTCPRCGKVFLHRGNLNNHLRKQKVCKVIHIKADREDIIKNYNKYEAEYESLQQQKQKRVYKLKVKPLPESKDKKSKLTKIEVDKPLTEISEVEPIIEELDEILETNQSTKNNDSGQAIVSKLSEIIDNLSKNMKSNNTNVATEGSNILHENSKQLNQHFNITVNTFGNEDLSHITKKDWHDIIKKNINAIPALTKKIYIDEERNRNVFLTSPKDGYCKVYTDDGWTYKGTRDIVQEIIGTNADRIYDYMIAMPNNESSMYRRMSNAIDKLGDDNSMVLRKNMADVKELFINYQGYNVPVLE